MRSIVTLLPLAVAFFVLHGTLVSQPTAYTRAQYQRDFDYLSEHLRRDYAYHESADGWLHVEARYRRGIDTVGSTGGFVTLLEDYLEELHDLHVHLTTNTPESAWLVPSGADVWGEWINGKAVITAVRAESHAERAGLRAGMRIVAVDGRAIDSAVIERLHGGSATPRARAWALLSILAGDRGRKRRISAVDDAGATADVVMASGGAGTPTTSLVESLRITPSVGYVRINNSLADLALVAAFDSALTALGDVSALVLDLRDTPGGGNTTVARGIMGRFADRELPYQKHVLVGEERAYGIRRSWLELVSPRPPMYRGAVAVLVDRWTGSMGEGIAIGLHAIQRAVVVGTPMAGLLGATQRITLPHTGIGVNIPVEQLYHIDGTPRERFVPDVVVDLARSDARRDAILDAAIDKLR